MYSSAKATDTCRGVALWWEWGSGEIGVVSTNLPYWIHPSWRCIMDGEMHSKEGRTSRSVCLSNRWTIYCLAVSNFSEMFCVLRSQVLNSCFHLLLWKIKNMLINWHHLIFSLPRKMTVCAMECVTICAMECVQLQCKKCPLCNTYSLIRVYPRIKGISFFNKASFKTKQSSENKICT